MKDILVEFTENGAIVYKSKAVIEEKTGNSNCLLNPDLSRVLKISPSFWMLDEYGKIIPCPEEEMKRRENYHSATVSAPKATGGTVHIGELKKEFKEKFDLNEEKVQLEINRLKQDISQIDEISQTRLAHLKSELKKNEELLGLTKHDIYAEQIKIEDLKGHMKAEIEQNERKLSEEIEKLKSLIEMNDEISHNNLNEMFQDLSKNKQMLNIAKQTIEEHQAMNKKRMKMAIYSIVALGATIVIMALSHL